MRAKTKCLIVDDEPLGIELIEKHLSNIETMQLVASCDNAMKAYALLRSEEIDLIFLDIQMPLITGLDFLRTLKDPPKVIITSAFRNYALEGFELDVIDYLLKPITFSRFLKAVEKFYLRENSNAEPAKAPQHEFIYLKSNKKNHKVSPADILFVESINDYIQIHSREGKLALKHTMSEVETLLGGKGFLRIHRSYLINVEKITAFTATEIEINKIELPIGTSYRQMVSSVLGTFKK